jgi:ketosteroid isomerase-like protein
LRETIDSYYGEMQAGPEGPAGVAALFADDGVYVEPFSGGTHVGPEAIRSFLAGSQGQLPDVRITVDRVDVDGETVETSWTCESSAFAKPSRGRDRFTVREGKIVRLETEIDEPPEFRGG